MLGLVCSFGFRDGCGLSWNAWTAFAENSTLLSPFRYAAAFGGLFWTCGTPSTCGTVASLSPVEVLWVFFWTILIPPALTVRNSVNYIACTFYILRLRLDGTSLWVSAASGRFFCFLIRHRVRSRSSTKRIFQTKRLVVIVGMDFYHMLGQHTVLYFW